MALLTTSSEDFETISLASVKEEQFESAASNETDASQNVPREVHLFLNPAKD